MSTSCPARSAACYRLLMVRPRWHDVVIGLWVLTLFLVGGWVVWGESLAGLWTEEPPIAAPEQSAPVPSAAELL